MGLHGLGQEQSLDRACGRTSVLNLAYQDTDKSLVLPVLEDYKHYQTYSGKDRRHDYPGH